MKTTLATQIAKLWNEKYANFTENSMTYAVVERDSVSIKPVGDNDGSSFYAVEELAAIAKAFRVHAYIACRSGKCVAYIF